MRTKSGSNPIAPKLEPDINIVALPEAGEYGGVIDSILGLSYENEFESCPSCRPTDATTGRFIPTPL